MKPPDEKSRACQGAGEDFQRREDTGPSVLGQLPGWTLATFSILLSVPDALFWRTASLRARIETEQARRKEVRP